MIYRKREELRQRVGAALAGPLADIVEAQLEGDHEAGIRDQAEYERALVCFTLDAVVDAAVTELRARGVSTPSEVKVTRRT